MVSADIKLDTVPPGSVTVEGNNFLYPPATPTTLGVMMDAPDDGQPYVRQSQSWAMMATPEAFAPGMVMMWAGAENQVPTGWQLCNGSGETTNGIQIPDLRSRFVIGAGASYETGDKGGSSSATTSSNGSHNHSVSVNSGGSHSHSVTIYSGGNHDHDFDTNSAGSHSHTVSVSSGGTHSHTVTVNGATLSEGQIPSHSHPQVNKMMNWDRGTGDMPYTVGGNLDHADYTGNHTRPIGSSGSHTHSASTASNTGSHSHSASTYSTGSHSHSGSTDYSGSHTHSGSCNSGGSHTHSASCGSSGGHSHTVSTLSPYYALAYIIKL